MPNTNASSIIGTIVRELLAALVPTVITKAREALKAHGVHVDEDTERLTANYLAAQLEAMDLALRAVLKAFEPPPYPLGLKEGLLDGMDVTIIRDDERD